MIGALRDSALLDSILAAAVDGMIVSDKDGTILRSNDAATKLFQHELAELVGQNVRILMPTNMADHHNGYIAHHIETGQRRIIGIGRDVEGLRKDGTVFPLHLSVGNAEVDGQRLFVAIMHDLTNRKVTEDALARSQRLDAIGQMTGGIAHDFNNLLTVIIGNLELLEIRGADDRQMPLIKDALDSAKLGADLTTRLMIFARKGNLKPVESDLREVCSQTLALLNRTLGASYHIKTDFSAHVGSVMIDPVQFQSALMNLALNARDAMGAGGELLVSVAGVTIDDTYMAQETDIEQGNYVCLSVSDNGAGMSIEAQRRAFEPFFTTKTKSGGTGLGLAMVYRFVKQSGGHIMLYSEVGLGTSFELFFPVLPLAQNGGIPHSDRTNVVYLGNGETVLVVEDNLKVRKLSIKRIRDLGYKILEAANGDIAYKMLKDGAHADILCSDLAMLGVLNGYDLAAKIATDFPDLKVLITSGHARDVVTDTLTHDTSFDILHKPYRQSDLAERLYALLAGSTDV
jgi:PAS domain S-box-containing protein